MRHIIILLLTILVSTFANAKCIGSGIYFLSSNRLLNRNGVLILQFNGTSQSLIKDLNKKYTVYLQSKKEKDTLSIIEILEGGFSTTEVILKPISPLKGDAEYVFRIGNLPKYESIPHDFNQASKKETAVIFKTTNTVDNEPPVLKDNPVETKKSMVEWGCGPAINVSFKINGEDKSELFVRASVKNEKTGVTTDYILEITKGEVEIGHGMCSGAFGLDMGGEYEVSFCLIDQSGNKGSYTNPLHFTAPAAPTKEG